MKQKLKQGSINTFSDMVAATLRCEELKEISQLVDICATFQASRADCERGFSLMNHIKTASRNRLEVAHLDQLMRIKSSRGSHRPGQCVQALEKREGQTGTIR